MDLTLHVDLLSVGVLGCSDEHSWHVPSLVGLPNGRDVRHYLRIFTGLLTVPIFYVIVVMLNEHKSHTVLYMCMLIHYIHLHIFRTKSVIPEALVPNPAAGKQYREHTLHVNTNKGNTSSGSLYLKSHQTQQHPLWIWGTVFKDYI